MVRKPSIIKPSIIICLFVCGIIAGDCLAKNEKNWTFVQGTGCVEVKPSEENEVANQKAFTLAKEQAIKGTMVWKEIVSNLNNPDLQHEILVHFTRANLRFIQIGKMERKGKEVCLSIKGKVEPILMVEEVEKRKKQEKVIQVTDSAPSNPKSAFDLVVKVDKKNGRYAEGELVVITVEAEKDSYLKLDYYQNDGKVIHLVPNLFQEKAFIKGGHRYEFGGEKSNFEFKVVKPFGPERIVATASTEPFDKLMDTPKTKEDGLLYAKHRIRGLVVQAKKPKVEVAVAMVKVYTQAKEPILQKQESELQM